MIKSYEHQKLNMDFSSMFQIGSHHPSDIDMVYIGKSDGEPVLILGEIKNRVGRLSENQKYLLEKFANNFKYKALCLFITHDKFTELGDTEVNVMECEVSQFYKSTERKWREPSRRIKVKEVLRHYYDDRTFEID